MKRRLASIVALAALAMTAACSDVSDQFSRDRPGEANTERPPLAAVEPENRMGGGSDTEAIAVGADAPAPEVFEFEGVDLYTGAVRDGTAIAENRPMIVAFVTPWCAVCATEAPVIAELAETRPEVSWLIVHSAGSASEFREFAADHDLDEPNITHLDDAGGAVWARFGVEQQPAFLIVDADGRTAGSTGGLGTDGLEAAVDRAAAGLA